MRKVYINHSAHYDLFWMYNMAACMEEGAEIIDNAVEDLCNNPDKYFIIETVRFLEYYLHKHPDKKSVIETLFERKQLEVGCCYSDRLENHHDGESLVRNVIYGKKILKDLLGIDTKIGTHPDLPGLSEQTPQIYNKSGVEYYLFARGYENGTRFLWKGLDGSTIVAYNYPIHYTYYDFDVLMGKLSEIEKAVHSEDLLISCSAGDLGKYGTFDNPAIGVVSLDEMISKYNNKDKDYQLIRANAYETLHSMDEKNLPAYSGESPSRWGTYGSATNVTIFQLDKRLSSLLLDGEKIAALCEINGIDTSGFQMIHPFSPEAVNRDTRRYFDRIVQPETPTEWIDFAWRLQIVTHDHNYGGYGGETTDRDRTLFKKCAIKIMEELIAYCLDLIGKHAESEGDFISINLLNWERSGKIRVPAQLMENMRRQTDPLVMNPIGKVSAVDSKGNQYPIVLEDGEAYINATIQPMSYETYVLEQKASDVQTGEAVIETEDSVTIENEYYRIVMCKKNTGITQIIDKESGENLVGERPIGIFNVFEDHSVDVHEERYDKKLLESSKGNTKHITFGETAAYLWARLETEICNSKILLEVRISLLKKEFEVLPTIYWIGTENVQLRMSFDLSPSYTNLYYGVPYGIQKFGNYIYGAEPANSSDEISKELFDEYREVQDWFAYEKDNSGISISTNQSSLSFQKGNLIDAVLIRNVKSCGDNDVLIPDHGKQAFYFVGTSYRNDSVLDNEEYYRRSVELKQELYSAVITKADTAAEKKLAKTLLDVSHEGILTVLRYEDGACYARFFSVTKSCKTTYLSHPSQTGRFVCCDLINNTIQEDPTILKNGEIKTIRLPVGNSH